MPRLSRPSIGQVLGDVLGSLTRSFPPTRRNGAAHSAVTAGAAKLLATTTSKELRRPSTNASARPQIGRARSVMPSSATAWRRNSTRRRCASNKVTSRSDLEAEMTKPGRPPPEPRSRTRLPSGMSGGHEAACDSCAPTGPGPRNPSSRLRVRISTSCASSGRSVVTRRSCQSAGLRPNQRSQRHSRLTAALVGQSSPNRESRGSGMPPRDHRAVMKLLIRRC